MSMKIVGLTGGVGMGKSACADMLLGMAIPVVDTDILARQVVEPGQTALGEIARLFGAEYVDAGGRLRRRELAQRVFADAEARKRLEAILHPRIRELWLAQMQAWEGQGHALAVVVIPLLFETEAQKELDATICVACSAATQKERLAGRHWGPEQIRQRIEAQLPIGTKMEKADFVIWNEASVAVHREQLKRILALLCS